MVGSGSDAENGVADVLELFGERQVDQEFRGEVWGERGNCRAGIAAQRARGRLRGQRPHLQDCRRIGRIVDETGVEGWAGSGWWPSAPAPESLVGEGRTRSRFLLQPPLAVAVTGD